MSEVNQEWITQADVLIRQGKSSVVKKNLKGLNLSKVPREFLAPVAQIARRVNLSLIGIRLLKQIVRSDKALSVKANEIEIITYASLINKIGIFHEGQDLLRQVDSKTYPEALLFQGFADILQWNYEKAKIVLKQYVKSTKINEYQIRVGKVNLAACYVAMNNSSLAFSLLEELGNESYDKKNWLLYVNVCEMRAQLLIQEGSLKEALKVIEHGKSFLRDQSNLYFFFMEKWTAIARFMAAPNNKTQNSIIEMKKRVNELGHWESLRELDLFLSLQSSSYEGLDHLFYGTPYKDYRQRILTLAPFYKPSDSYVWNLGGEPSKGQGYSIDLRMGDLNGNSDFLKAGSLIHKLLCFLSQDFYRPSSVGKIFNGIYHGDYYDPDSSRRRVEQLIHRMNQNFKDFGVPSLVKRYKLKALGPVSLYFYKDQPIAEKMAVRWEILKDNWGYQSFTLSQAAEVLGCSKKTAERFIQLAIKEEKIQAQGRTRSRKFVCIRPAKKLDKVS